MDQIQEVKQTLAAHSTTTTVDELKARGRSRVKVVKAEQIAAMISEAVKRAVSDSGLLSQEEHEELVDRSRQEFQSMLQQREREVQELAQVRADLETANQRADELRQALEQLQAGGGGAGGGASLSGGDANALSAMLDKLSGTLNERLDKFGKKIGISTAVEADEVKFDSLFNQDVAADLESNMDDVQVKKKTGGGIGSNLERLKKLKGDG